MLFILSHVARSDLPDEVDSDSDSRLKMAIYRDRGVVYTLFYRSCVIVNQHAPI